mgnify:CR=1 FL=1
MKHYILTLEITDYKIPKIIALYLISDKEWNEIRNYLESDFYFYIKDYNFCDKDIEISKNTLHYDLNDKDEHINAFKILFKNYFGTYEILSHIRQNAFESPNKKKNKNKKIETIFQMDDDTSTNLNEELNYYLMTKKNTPEFSNIEDAKVLEYIKEAKKVIEQFKVVDNIIKYK